MQSRLTCKRMQTWTLAHWACVTSKHCSVCKKLPQGKIAASAQTHGPVQAKYCSLEYCSLESHVSIRTDTFSVHADGSCPRGCEYLSVWTGHVSADASTRSCRPVTSAWKHFPPHGYLGPSPPSFNPSAPMLRAVYTYAYLVHKQGKGF
jgi:hypothetical protein